MCVCERVYELYSGLFRRINELMENYHSKAHIKPYLAYEKHGVQIVQPKFPMLYRKSMYGSIFPSRCYSHQHPLLEQIRNDFPRISASMHKLQSNTNQGMVMPLQLR